VSNIWTVIPAAGESKRFREAGYSMPKPLLRIKSPAGEEAYMVQHVIADLPSWLRAGVVIALPSHLDKPIDLEERTISIPHTIGQADTVYQAIKTLPDNDLVLVLDCDMILKSEDILKLVELLNIYDVTVAVTETFDPNASRVDQVPFPSRFVEKEPISKWGIVGARAFKSAAVLSVALERTFDRCTARHQEPYLSMAMNPYPGSKFAHVITDYIDLGTPERIKEAGWEIL